MTTAVDPVAPGLCACGTYTSREHACEYRLVACPCCGDSPWCPEEWARVAAEAAAAPEISGAGWWQ